MPCHSGSIVVVVFVVVILSLYSRLRFRCRRGTHCIEGREKITFTTVKKYDNWLKGTRSIIISFFPSLYHRVGFSVHAEF